MPKRLPKFSEGDKINSWTILHEVEDNKSTTYYCRCVCGNRKKVSLSNLYHSKSKSCGKGDCRNKHIKHGLTTHPLYYVWCGIKSRLANPIGKNECYEGIQLAPEWEDFESFYTWAVNNGYQKGLTIDRKNRKGNYTPSNCRWVDRIVQSQNRSGHKTAEVPYKGVFKRKPRRGKVLYTGTGKAPYYWLITYKGKKHQKWGFTSAEEAYEDKCNYIKKNLDGLVYP